MSPRRQGVVRGPAVIPRSEARGSWASRRPDVRGAQRRASKDGRSSHRVSAGSRRTSGHFAATRAPKRLYLITPPIEDAGLFTADLQSALEAADVGAVL